MTRSQDPLEELVDALIYAPIGIALDIVERYPEYVARGRRQVEVFEKLGGAVLRGFGFAASASATRESRRTEADAEADRPATMHELEGAQDELIDSAAAIVDEAFIEEVAETSAEITETDLEAILEGTVGEVSGALGNLSAPEVNELIELEKADKNRVTVLRAATKRLDDLRNAS